MDGSEHNWFEWRRPKATVMVMIDDATHCVHARFSESETAAAAATVFQEYVGHYGLPRALHLDRSTIYETTRDTAVASFHGASSQSVPLVLVGGVLRL